TRFLGYLALALVFVVLDRLTKNLAQHFLRYHKELEVIPGFFNLSLAFNKGAAFSFLSHSGGWQRWFLSGISTTISLVIIVWLYRLKPYFKLRSFSLALILGGALGNLWDRALYGQVTDFLLFYIGDFVWPAFNLADSCVVIG